MKTQTHHDVETYYGEILGGHKDLKTSACCAAEAPPPRLAAALRKVPLEIQERFYGCGAPFPSSLEGLAVLDLGSGSGRDCYLLSELVGEKGRVIGIDMTSSQLALARRHVEGFTKALGYGQPNMDFRQGLIEDLAAADVASGSIDVLISNCVINLSPRKDLVLAEAFRVLKPGGELYFSDVYASRRLPAEVQKDPILVGECLGGALYWQDFRRLMARAGFLDFRVVSRNPVTIASPELRNTMGPVTFESITVRAFKLDLEDACEDYGQAACYLGSDPSFPHAFVLDDHHTFETGRLVPVCRNTAQMLSETRFQEHFRIFGDTRTHYGLFACGEAPPTGSEAPVQGACC